MKEKNGLVINVGTSSVVLILMVISLSVFALLSIRASNSELKLAIKTGESVQEYYDADKAAEYGLSYIKAALESSKIEDLEKNLLGMDTSKQKELSNFGGLTLNLKKNVIFTGKKDEILGNISYAIKITEKKRLEVKLDLCGDRSVLVTSWKIVKEAEQKESLDSGIELWDGQVTTD